MPAGETYMTTDRMQVAHIEIARGVAREDSSLQPLTDFEVGVWNGIVRTFAEAKRDGLIVDFPQEWPSLEGYVEGEAPGLAHIP